MIWQSSMLMAGTDQRTRTASAVRTRRRTIDRMARGGVDELELRGARADDNPQVLELLVASLGWVPDEAYASYFAWKHSGPFGASPSWVAVDGDRIAGFRTFMRWEFERGGT